MSMDKPMTGLPKDLGYRMPAEWEPHAGTWLSWPHNRNSWPGKFEPIPGIWKRLVETLAHHEQVHVLAGKGPVYDEAMHMVGSHPKVTLHDVPTNDAWCRDHGPTFLVGPKGKEAALVDWGYNAWGGKYPPFDQDDLVPSRVANILGRARFQPGIVLEGGAIDGNGLGAMLTTEECLLNPNRNPHLSREDMERLLKDYLGVSHIVWLGRGIVGDDTDGHIDELARFVGPRTIVAALEDQFADPNYEPLQDNFRRLLEATDQQGRKFQVIPLPMPEPIFHEDQRLPASYCNFYIANDLVIVPQFEDASDGVAMGVLKECFPDREVLGLPARDLAWGLGAYHCITQQEPALP